MQCAQSKEFDNIVCMALNTGMTWPGVGLSVVNLSTTEVILQAELIQQSGTLMKGKLLRLCGYLDLLTDRVHLTLSSSVTGQFADKPTCSQSSRRLDNSRTSQLADSECLKVMELLHFICTLNLTLTITLTLLNTGSV